MKVKFTTQSLQDYFSFNIAELTHFVSGNINMSGIMIAKHPRKEVCVC